MSGWQGSDRRQRLPKDWPKRRARILRRDRYRCQWLEDGRVCGFRATDVDHIVPNDDHSDLNLQSLCGPHHRVKSAREGVAARRPRARPAQRHPGVIR